MRFGLTRLAGIMALVGSLAAGGCGSKQPPAWYGSPLPAAPWPAEGSCRSSDQTPCIRLMPEDATAIQALLLATFTTELLAENPHIRDDLRDARKFAEWPISKETIGGYKPVTQMFRHRPVIALIGIKKSTRFQDEGFIVRVARGEAGWEVVTVWEFYLDGHPQITARDRDEASATRDMRRRDSAAWRYSPIRSSTALHSAMKLASPPTRFAHLVVAHSSRSASGRARGSAWWVRPRVRAARCRPFRSGAPRRAPRPRVNGRLGEGALHLPDGRASCFTAAS
ncbi:MAG: hypothetical protein SFX73_38485 [Kofleriaceae bacterium]|nr:hypothetical protein [Kofleriaceae bacterium]